MCYENEFEKNYIFATNAVPLQLLAMKVMIHSTMAKSHLEQEQV